MKRKAPTFDTDVEEIGEEAAGTMKLTIHPHAHHDSSILVLSTVVIQISKQPHLITKVALSAAPYYPDPTDISTERKHLSVPGVLYRQAHL